MGSRRYMLKDTAGEVVGPYRVRDVVSMISEGRVTRDWMIRAEQDHLAEMSGGDEAAQGRKRTKWTWLNSVPQFQDALANPAPRSAPEEHSTPNPDTSSPPPDRPAVDPMRTSLPDDDPSKCPHCGQVLESGGVFTQTCAKCRKLVLPRLKPRRTEGIRADPVLPSNLREIINDWLDEYVDMLPLGVVMVLTFVVSVWATTRSSAAAWSAARSSGFDGQNSGALSVAKWAYFHDFMLGSGLGLAASVLVLAGVTLWKRFPRTPRQGGASP